MGLWVQKEGYDTCLQATGEVMQSPNTEVYLIRFREGKFSHYHKSTTEFFHFTAGSGRILMDDREVELYPGVSLVIPPYVKHMFINNSNDILLEAVMVKTNTHPEDTFIV
ncbi:cupin domain-containing protein [Desulfosediminicola flagellatus]|uniref:cupin domain-containing protein n=1 Tax=Desulfosediminicola flagellatus TaxID=2569541 RepID=UPI0010ABB8FE|nr:cupin domain-containing protein [Desulfosediminicola flagellatus]